MAESTETVFIEGNHYFPVASVNEKYLHDSNTRTWCPWKGTVSYYYIEIDDKSNADAAWYYPNPSEAAKFTKDHIAFWKGVEILE